jgi:hypothetical protein
LVYLEYQQQGQSPSADFGYLSAVNLASGATISLAQATSGPALEGLPWYDARDGYAVWNEAGPLGTQQLWLHDFALGQSRQLPLPTGMAPVEPAVSGKTVVFVDNSTDPNRDHEDFLGRRGSLRKFDILSGQASTISAEPTAWMPRILGEEIVWTSIGGAANPLSVASLNGGSPTEVAGSSPISPQTNGALVVWYDSETLHFMVLNPKNGRIVELLVGVWSEVVSQVVV